MEILMEDRGKDWGRIAERGEDCGKSGARSGSGLRLGKPGGKMDFSGVFGVKNGSNLLGKAWAMPGEGGVRGSFREVFGALDKTGRSRIFG
jgi:hypothetical protein